MYKNKTKNSFRKAVSGLILFCFLTGQIFTPTIVQAQVLPNLPVPGQMVWLTTGFQPPVLRGMTVHPENPLLFDFIVDRGQDKINNDLLKGESTRLIKYFLASMTIPDKDAWVNLSPYEKDRIIPDALGQTEMGRQMLEQDYMLKQLAASLTNPDTELGKKYWEQVNKSLVPGPWSLENANQALGTNHQAPSLTKVWIVPAGATVVEKDGFAYITESKLDVKMEEDYKNRSLVPGSWSLERKQQPGTRNQPPGTLQQAPGTNPQGPAAEVFRSLILPKLIKEVNEGKTFAPTRQVYQSVILAAWYKKALKDSLLGRIYADKSKVAGVESDVKDIKQKVYDQYLEAFKKGVYNVIKEEGPGEETVPRKYFSGGLAWELKEGENLNFDTSAGAVKRAASAVNKAGTEGQVVLVAASAAESGTGEEQLLSAHKTKSLSLDEINSRLRQYEARDNNPYFIPGSLMVLINELHELDFKLLVTYNRDGKTRNPTVTLQEYLDLAADESIRSFRITDIKYKGKFSDSTSIPTTILDKFEDRWIIGRLEAKDWRFKREIIEAQVVFQSGITAEVSGNAQMLLAVAENPDIVRISYKSIGIWLPFVTNISPEERKSGYDWKAKYIGQIKSESLSAAGLVGQSVAHGTLEGFEDSVKAGAMDVGNDSWSGSGLALDLDPNHANATESALDARDESQAKIDIAPKRFTGSKKPVVMQGHIINNPNVKVAHFVVSRNAGYPNLAKGILPIRWNEDPNLRAVLMSLDILDIKTHGDWNDNHMLVVHESAGNVIRWEDKTIDVIEAENSIRNKLIFMREIVAEFNELLQEVDNAAKERFHGFVTRLWEATLQEEEQKVVAEMKNDPDFGKILSNLYRKLQTHENRMRNINKFDSVNLDSEFNLLLGILDIKIHGRTPIGLRMIFKGIYQSTDIQISMAVSDLITAVYGTKMVSNQSSLQVLQELNLLNPDNSIPKEVEEFAVFYSDVRSETQEISDKEKAQKKRELRFEEDRNAKIKKAAMAVIKRRLKIAEFDPESDTHELVLNTVRLIIDIALRNLNQLSGDSGIDVWYTQTDYFPDQYTLTSDVMEMLISSRLNDNATALFDQIGITKSNIPPQHVYLSHQFITAVEQEAGKVLRSLKPPPRPMRESASSSLADSKGLSQKKLNIQPAMAISARDVGGIDFDPSKLNLQIKRDGHGVPLPLPQQNLEQININGLYPVILNIRPINAQTLPILGQLNVQPEVALSNG